MTEPDPDWIAQRTEAARVQADRLAQRQNAEHVKAEALLAEFLPVVLAHGPAPEQLQVGGFDGRGQAKSNVRGWYLRKNHTVGLGIDGKFYILSAPLSFKDRFRAVQITPTRPPLQLGKGGRDGEAMDLSEALEQLFPNWRTFQQRS